MPCTKKKIAEEGKINEIKDLSSRSQRAARLKMRNYMREYRKKKREAALGK